MGVGGQERRKKKTQNVPVHELHGVKKNQAMGRAETAAWAQGKKPCQAHREELGKQDSGTCSEIQDSTCREQPEVVGGEANPHGCSRSSAAETPALQREGILLKALSSSSSQHRSCRATGPQCAKKASRGEGSACLFLFLFFCLFWFCFALVLFGFHFFFLFFSCLFLQLSASRPGLSSQGRRRSRGLRWS